MYWNWSKPGPRQHLLSSVPGWHENLYDPTLADAICDRIVHDSYVIQIHSESMRKRKGLIE